MKELSLFEKLQILFSNVIAHPFFLIILTVPMVIMFLERDTTKKEKDVKKIILFIYIIVISIVLFIGGSTLFEFFDNVMDELFMALYFPNFITLFVVIVINAVIALISVFRKKIKKSIKRVNFIGFAVVQTLFCLILSSVKANKINIYKENALYSNNDVLSLMQLLMGAFLLQIIIVSVITLINRLTEMLDEKDNILTDTAPVKVNNEAIINKEIKEKKNIILETNNLKDLTKLDLMKPMDVRDKILTINNLKILKSKKNLLGRCLKYYKKTIISTYEDHPIENLKIINFNLMVKAIQNTNVKKRNTNGYLK